MKYQTNEDKILKGAGLIAEGFGLNLNDENFVKTPERIKNTLLYYFRGLHEKKAVIKELKIDFPSKYKGIIALRNLEGTSLCPHHFLPIVYRADFAYIPNKKVTGASKPYKLFSTLTKQPIMQEELTEEFINVFWRTVAPKGCMIKIEGRFFCHDKEDIDFNNSTMVTYLAKGCFQEEKYNKQFHTLIR